jgi:N utilization substance protein B
MANRHLLRTALMQALYESEFHPDRKLQVVLDRRLADLTPSDEDRKYIEQAAAGLEKRHDDIDKLIVKNAPEWPLEQIAAIDRAVLRLGIYEVLWSDEVPPKVAINEAVEIAKQYGGENSGSFVNGVLGTVYRNSDKYEAKDDKDDRSSGQAEAGETAPKPASGEKE